MDEECTVPRDEEAARTLPPCRFKGVVDVALPSHLYRLQLHPEGLRRHFRFLQGQRVAGICRIEQDGQPRG